MDNKEILFLTVAGNKIIDKCNNDMVVNNVEIDNSISNIYTGAPSMKFNGMNSYIELPCTEEFNFSNNDFTIDWWEYRNTLARGNAVLCIQTSITDTSLQYTIGVGGIDNKNPSMYIRNGTNGETYINSNTLLAYAQSWTHQAVVRKGNTISFFTNGNLLKREDTSVVVGYNPTYKIDIGVRARNYFNGNLQNIRVSNYARWDNSFDLYSVNPSFYIKQNNKYYSFSKDNYDTVTKMYKEITSDDINNNLYLCNLSDLTEEVTIGEETFKPIDKFNNFQFVSKYNEPKTIIGRKSKTGMSIPSGDIYTKVASKINSFTLDNTVNNNSYIKMAVSFDNGATWKTYKDNSFSDLNITIANKTYEDMTVDEKNNWESAKETILSEGFTTDILSTIDFNTINDLRTIRFAYVLYQDLINDSCGVNKLSWNFNANGKFQKMKESEIETYFSDGLVTCVATKNQDMIITNYIY